MAAGYQSATGYNANQALIEAALENTLSLDGTAPNAMSDDLDMNSQGITNIATLNGVDASDLTVAGSGTGIFAAAINIPTATPLSGGAGTAGDVAWDASYIYICTATNTWARAALTGGY